MAERVRELAAEREYVRPRNAAADDALRAR
jgi:hypothetical protein